MGTKDRPKSTMTNVFQFYFFIESSLKTYYSKQDFSGSSRGIWMHKCNLLVVGVAILAIFSFGLVVAGESEESMCIPMGDIVIEPPDQVESKRAAVTFPHATHFSYTCNTCHHTWDRETPVLSCMATGCHDVAAIPKNAEGNKIDPELSARYYKAAYHSACIGCHKEIKQQNKAIENSYRSAETTIQSSGPTGCSECHPKE